MNLSSSNFAFTGWFLHMNLNCKVVTDVWFSNLFIFALSSFEPPSQQQPASSEDVGCNGRDYLGVIPAYVELCRLSVCGKPQCCGSAPNGCYCAAVLVLRGQRGVDGTCETSPGAQLRDCDVSHRLAQVSPANVNCGFWPMA